MWFFHFSLIFFGAASILLVVLLTLLTNRFPNVLNTIGAIICWSIAAAFFSGFALYRFLRRPSRRQARIREVVASRLGPFSDPADWASELVARVAPAFGIAVLSGDELIRTAERLLKQEHVEDALVVARMALSLTGPPSELDPGGRSEDITEECLHLLDRAG
jgi:hypothetical protein